MQISFHVARSIFDHLDIVCIDNFLAESLLSSSLISYCLRKFTLTQCCQNNCGNVLTYLVQEKGLTISRQHIQMLCEKGFTDLLRLSLKMTDIRPDASDLKKAIRMGKLTSVIYLTHQVGLICNSECFFIACRQSNLCLLFHVYKHLKDPLRSTIILGFSHAFTANQKRNCQFLFSLTADENVSCVIKFLLAKRKICWNFHLCKQKERAIIISSIFPYKLKSL